MCATRLQQKFPLIQDVKDLHVAMYVCVLWQLYIYIYIYAIAYPQGEVS